MKMHDKIRHLRELNNLSQEEIAEKVNMSPSGYAKIERGETRLTLERLGQLSEVFKIDISKMLLSEGDYYYQINENTHNNGHIFNTSGDSTKLVEVKLQHDIERLKLTLDHKEEMITKLEEQIRDLKALNLALKK